MTLVPQPKPSFTLVTMLLPGPDRKRTPSPYHFRVTFRSPTPADVGCVATWAVLGGRDEYQIALERTPERALRWHCSCADATYRGAVDLAHSCKHVHGLVEHFELIGNPVRHLPARSQGKPGLSRV